jgi:hypothetical protein
LNESITPWHRALHTGFLEFVLVVFANVRIFVGVLDQRAPFFSDHEIMLQRRFDW